MTAQEARSITDLKIKESVEHIIEKIEDYAKEGLNSFTCNELDKSKIDYFQKLDYDVTYNKYTRQHTIRW